MSSLAVIAALLSALPWLFPSAPGLAAGLLVHAIWFVVCERFAPGPSARPAGRSQSSASAVDGMARPQIPTTAHPGARVMRPRGFVQAPVLAVFDETADIRTFRLARPEGFDFKPGQFLTVRVRVDGKDVARCYSISSSPSTPGYLEISVKRQGLVSNTLHATLRPGSQVAVRAPAGVFTYPDADDRPLLLLAGGIGITPVLSMLRHAVTAEPTRPVALLYCARTEEGFAFRRDLALITARHPHAKIVLASSHAADPYIYPGRIDDSLIRTTVPEFANAVAMICGPQPMIDAMRALLLQMGVPAAQVRSEVFEAAVAAAGGKPLTATVADDDGDAQGEAHRMQCTRAGQAVQVQAGQTLLDAAEAAGIPIDSLCRSGVCGTCRTKVIDGHVECTSALLDDEDRAGGFVLACVAHVRSDCVVEA
ncbi:MAG: iron-sulfur cluster-binding domain-containing protein [Acidobacteriota bacterium]